MILIVSKTNLYNKVKSLSKQDFYNKFKIFFVEFRVDNKKTLSIILIETLLDKTSLLHS